MQLVIYMFKRISIFFLYPFAVVFALVFCALKLYDLPVLGKQNAEKMLGQQPIINFDTPEVISFFSAPSMRTEPEFFDFTDSPQSFSEEFVLPLPEGGKTEDKTAPQTFFPVKAVSMIPKDSSGYIIYKNVFISNKSTKTFDVDKIMSRDVTFKVTKASKGPQVLIVHTHATEAFRTPDTQTYEKKDEMRNTDNTQNVVAVGRVLKEGLEQNGIKTLQCETQHDNPDYTGAYKKSLDSINYYLKQYPTIKVVIDLHRDTIINDENIKYQPLASIDGRNAAQMMIIVGTGTKAVSNPHYNNNLRFATQFQNRIEEKYPALCRPLLIKDNPYNMQASSGGMLIEMGSCGNTLEESKYTAELIAPVLAQLIASKIK